MQKNISPRATTVFDGKIQHYHALFLLPYDWRLLKAQLIAESGLNPTAKSLAGAMGLAQFMPDTWVEMLKALNMPADTSPYDSDASIKCCAYYMATLLKKWTAQRPEIDRYCLTLASYNAGSGNILKAQRLTDGSNDYCRIIDKLIWVTGKDNAKQTSDYAKKILTEWQAIILEV